MSEIIPNISVDCVIFGFDGKDINVLLVERELRSEHGERLFLDHTVLGYHINRNDDLDKAAADILYELTGLEDIFLEQVFTFGAPERLMNERDQQWIKSRNFTIDIRTITIVYYALIDNTKVQLQKTERKANWFPIHKLPELGFDHKEIVFKAYEKLQEKVLFEPIAFKLLPEKFTLTQLQNLYEALLDTVFDRRNFRKKVSQMRYIIPLNEKQKGVAHKPAQLYFFSREVYNKTRKDRFVISI